eukprot:TRINITY_DN6000_c0_g1_i1.p1 TRINITY_DN6000_c0_g1~~TRINITY_DN6000_c0_g1_i1.p1  ORF type:complete len:232 (-),score=82.00 TRINITY_DN6000_c0_g1_i1:761-1456(-)
MAGLEEKAPKLEYEEATTSTAEASGDADDAAKAEEEDTGAEIAPIVKLEEVAVTSGEENEDCLYEVKAKLYRFDKDGNQWKERGVGQVKLLEHKESKKIRLLMRQNRTLKICANHVVLPGTQLQEHAGSEKSWVWHATDFADGELKEELFAMRFGSIETAQKFKTAYEEAQDKMSEVLGTQSEEAAEAADSAADLLGGLKVQEDYFAAPKPDEPAPDSKEKSEPASEVAKE